MYAVPGIGLAAPAGWRVAAHLRDRSVRRPGSQRADRHGQPRVAGARGDATRGRRLPEPSWIHRDGAPPRARRRPWSGSPGRGAHGRGHRTPGPRAAARDGSPRRPPVRGSPPRHQAGPDRPQDQETGARWSSGKQGSRADRILRHPRVRGPHARGSPALHARGGAGRDAARPSTRTWPAGVRRTGQATGRRAGGFPCDSPTS